ncbi:MAG TPA: metalloregulator ArsR/SmtB family transcription factor [Caulobacteraceae bacterium]|nr:metalloregulator ArsR/SmtB family transcription factor [Caulobacteraceae bacterium]
MTETLLAFFKALADESRLKIVGLLAQGERSVQELATLLDLKEPTVSHHLAILRAQGLVSARAEGTTRWHRLDVDVLEGLSRRVLESPAASETREPETWDAKVLRGFVDADGRLHTIPASRRKRGVVLRWLMTGFAEGRRYREAEVNAIIQARHWDSATLRRELIGHRMLARENGVYWRLPQDGWNEGGAAAP